MKSHPIKVLYRRTAPAKVNLGLHVLRRRSDGYHDVETVLVPINWTDQISVEPADQIRMSCSDPTLPTDKRNLCIQAAQRLAAKTDTTKGAHISLEKHLPYGAGLGGGSSDAALTLQLLADLWDLTLSEKELMETAAELGADVPFFITQKPAYAFDRGDRLEPLEAGYRLPYTLVVVMPPVTVSTAEAYALVRPHTEKRADLRCLVASNDLERWRLALVNDFEEPILKRYPVVQKTKEQLLARGAGYAALTGSGAAVFGVFEAEEEAQAAAWHFAEQKGFRSWWGEALNKQQRSATD